MYLPSPSAVILLAALALIVIGLLSMTYQRSVKMEQRKKTGDSKALLSMPDSLGAGAGCIPGALGLLLIVVGIVLLILLVGQYANSHPSNPAPTPEAFQSFLI